MFEFIKIQFKMGRITAEYVERCAALGWITPDESIQIIGEK